RLEVVDVAVVGCASDAPNGNQEVSVAPLRPLRPGVERVEKRVSPLVADDVPVPHGLFEGLGHVDTAEDPLTGEQLLNLESELPGDGGGPGAGEGAPRRGGSVA